MHQTMTKVHTRVSASLHCSRTSDTPLSEQFDGSAVTATEWPFHPEDISPLAWWRTLPSNRLRDAEHLLLRAALDQVHVLQQPCWIAARRGDPSAAIATAMALLPITHVTLTVDLAMSTVLLAALGGDAAAAVMLAHVLRQAEFDHPLAAELAESWLVSGLRGTVCSSSHHRFRLGRPHLTSIKRGMSSDANTDRGTATLLLPEGDLS